MHGSIPPVISVKTEMLLKSKKDESQKRQGGWIGMLQTAARNTEGWVENELNNNDSDEDDDDDDDDEFIYG